MMSDKAAAAWAFNVPDPNPLPAAGVSDNNDDSCSDIMVTTSGSDADSGGSDSGDPDCGGPDSDEATMGPIVSDKRKRRPPDTTIASNKKKRGNADETAHKTEEAAHRVQVLDMAMLTTEARIKVKEGRRKKAAESKRGGRKVAAHHRPDYIVQSHAPSNLATMEVPTPSLTVQPPAQARIPQLTVVEKVGGA